MGHICLYYYSWEQAEVCYVCVRMCVCEDVCVCVCEDVCVRMCVCEDVCV